MMFNLQQELIKEKLDAIGFDEIAHRTGFDSNYSKKIDAFSFLFAFMKMYSARANSLSQWAACIGQINGEVVSKQAINQRLTDRHCACFKEVVRALLARHYEQASKCLWTDFPRVFIQDSTCWSLPASLANQFPGSYSKKGEAATARLQVCYEIKANQFHEFTLQSFRDNDQKHASSITALACAGDLVIRDLGYFSQSVFDELAQLKAFFVSRLHYRVALYDIGGTRIDLLKLTSGKEEIDLPLLLGSTKKVPVRLVGVKLPPNQANERRRKAKKKDTRFTPNKDYLTWLGWCFYITNLPAERYDTDRICRFYRLRWRIEMIFKGFKSGLHWKEMFDHKRLAYQRMVITTYAMLIYVILCWRCFSWFYNKNPSLSLIKFLHWYRLNYDLIMQSASLSPFLLLVAKHCSYEKRRSRKNYAQLIELNPAPQKPFP